MELYSTCRQRSSKIVHYNHVFHSAPLVPLQPAKSGGNWDCRESRISRERDEESRLGALSHGGACFFTVDVYLPELTSRYSVLSEMSVHFGGASGRKGETETARNLRKTNLHSHQWEEIGAIRRQLTIRCPTSVDWIESVDTRKRETFGSRVQNLAECSGLPRGLLPCPIATSQRWSPLRRFNDYAKTKTLILNFFVILLTVWS